MRKAEREQNKTKRQSQIRNTKQGFVKENVGEFRYKPRGDWFTFAKVRKLCLLKQMRETSISQRHAQRIRPTSSAGTLLHTTVSRSDRKVFISFEICIFFLQKLIDFWPARGLYSPPGAVCGTFYYGLLKANTCSLQR